ncbi:hypothetical protein [Rhodococcus sp. IEGM 1330]|uniref:hypothetical protein n=1 Tax=Rhodococcus sp. IEGM 1330 TaxID=3082225 RepID=UPI0029532018|nr:hypothetical protein [Rhodococcus sp. IEGM 1330]MDV8025315.1 hypothetical protein [Rhodococcus sp. IEGM 1330]
MLLHPEIDGEGSTVVMDSVGASTVVDLALVHAFVDSMDVVAAKLSILGWTPHATDGEDTCIDQQWEYPPSGNLWRIHTGQRGAEFFMGFIVNTVDEASALDFVRLARSIIAPWSRSSESTHLRDEFDSEVWKDNVRVITLRLLPGTSRRVGKSVPPALQLTVQDVGSRST